MAAVELSAADLVADLRNRGLRVTAARRAICSVLAESHGEHLTAIDIQERASMRAGARIDQSTVYRTLDVFEELGRLHHVHLGHGPGIVHLVEERDHHHLVCELCGTSVDIPIEDLEDVFGSLANRYGFTPNSVHFALVGTCHDLSLIHISEPTRPPLLSRMPSSA